MRCSGKALEVNSGRVRTRGERGEEPWGLSLSFNYPLYNLHLAWLRGIPCIAPLTFHRRHTKRHRAGSTRLHIKSWVHFDASYYYRKSLSDVGLVLPKTTKDEALFTPVCVSFSADPCG